MMTLFALFGATFAAGAVVLFVGIHSAPEGYEDETGFHVVWRNNHPEAADVACVWDIGSALAR